MPEFVVGQLVRLIDFRPIAADNEYDPDSPQDKARVLLIGQCLRIKSIAEEPPYRKWPAWLLRLEGPDGDLWPTNWFRPTGLAELINRYKEAAHG